MANTFTCEGRLGADAETRFTPSGAKIVSFSIGTTTGFGDREKTMWVKGLLFGKLADSKLVDYLLKGTHVFVSGELNQKEFKGRSGDTIKMLELIVSNVKMIGSKASAAKPAEPQRSGGIPQAETMPDYDEFQDDIPF